VCELLPIVNNFRWQTKVVVVDDSISRFDLIIQIELGWNLLQESNPLESIYHIPRERGYREHRTEVRTGCVDFIPTYLPIGMYLVPLWSELNSKPN